MKNLQNILKYKFIKSCMLYFCQCLLKSITLDQGCPKFLHGGPYCTFHELSRATQLLVKCLEYFYSETYTLSFVLCYKIKEF